MGYTRSYVNPFGSFHEPDPVLGYHGKPNFRGRFRQREFDVLIAHNDQGFRRQEHLGEASPERKNVYVLGDSFVWGYGISQGREFTDQLNLLMPGYRVWNFGLAGSGTVQQYVIFEKHVLPQIHRGDLVLLAFFVNDFADNVGRILHGSLYAKLENGAVRMVPPDGSAVSGSLKNKLKDWSALFNLLSYCVDRWRSSRRSAAPLPSSSDRATLVQANARMADDGPEVKITKFYLAAFKKACDEKQTRLAIAYIPGQAELGEDDVSRTEDIAQPEQAACRRAFFRCTDELKIDTIDLLPYLLRAKKAGQLERVTFRYDFHWNEGGHRLAAEVITLALTTRAGADPSLQR